MQTLYGSHKKYGEIIEKVKKRATKLIISLKHLPYTKRLKQQTTLLYIHDHLISAIGFTFINQSINIFISDNKVHSYTTTREKHQTGTKKTDYIHVETNTVVNFIIV